MTPPADASAGTADRVVGDPLIATFQSNLAIQRQQLERMVSTAAANQASLERLQEQQDRSGHWQILWGCLAVVMLAGGVGVGWLLANKSRKLAEAELARRGTQPLIALIHESRDAATLLVQRLRMAGATDTRLYQALIVALPALQTEAGKATVNLNRLLPESVRKGLEGLNVPLELAATQAETVAAEQARLHMQAVVNQASQAARTATTRTDPATPSKRPLPADVSVAGLKGRA